MVLFKPIYNRLVRVEGRQAEISCLFGFFRESENVFHLNFSCSSHAYEERSHTHQGLYMNLFLQARMNLISCCP